MREINERIGNALKCYHLAKSLLWNTDIDRKCKITIHNVHYTITYVAETRTCTKTEERKLQGAEIKFQERQN
jgi:hypothetical protein